MNKNQHEKLYHFQLGDSTEGQVGVAGEVRATSKDDAARQLQDYLEMQDHCLCLPAITKDGYINVYFNPKRKITREDFDSSLPIKGEMI
jgi:hypothetical protein